MGARPLQPAAGEPVGCLLDIRPGADLESLQVSGGGRGGSLQIGAWPFCCLPPSFCQLLSAFLFPLSPALILVVENLSFPASSLSLGSSLLSDPLGAGSSPAQVMDHGCHGSPSDYDAISPSRREGRSVELS